MVDGRTDSKSLRRIPEGSDDALGDQWDFWNGNSHFPRHKIWSDMPSGGKAFLADSGCIDANRQCAWDDVSSVP